MRVFWAENRISRNEHNNAPGLCCVRLCSPAWFFVFHLFIFLVPLSCCCCCCWMCACACVHVCAGVRVNVTRRNMKTSCSPDGNLYFPPVTLCAHVSLLLHYAFTPVAFPHYKQHTHIPCPWRISSLLFVMYTHAHTETYLLGLLLTITWHLYIILWTTITNPLEYWSTLHHQSNIHILFLHSSVSENADWIFNKVKTIIIMRFNSSEIARTTTTKVVRYSIVTYHIGIKYNNVYNIVRPARASTY